MSSFTFHKIHKALSRLSFANTRVGYRSVRIWLVISLLGIAVNLDAQTREIDSLRTVANGLQGEKKIDALNAMNLRLLLFDIDLASTSLQATSALATKLQYEKGLIEAAIYLGMIESFTSGRSSLLQLRKGANEANRLGLDALEGLALQHIGLVYRSLGIYDSAKLEYDAAYRVLSDSLNPWHLSSLLNDIGRFHSATFNTREELHYFQRAWNIARLLPDKQLQVDILTNLSSYYSRQYDFASADEYMRRAEELLPQIPNGWEVSNFNALKANIYILQGDAPEALKWFNKAKAFYEDTKEVTYASLLIRIGYLLEQMGAYDVSLQNHFEALEIARQGGFLQEEARAHLGIAWNYYLLGMIPEATEAINIALEISRKHKFAGEEARVGNLKGLILLAKGKYDDALATFEVAFAQHNRVGDKLNAARTITEIGETYEAMGEFQRAIDYGMQSLKIQESLFDKIGLAWTNLNLGSAHAKSGRYNYAFTFLDNAEHLARQTKNGLVLIRIFEVRRTILLSQEKFREAIRYSLLYEQLKDSVASASASNRISTLQRMYELDRQRELEIDLLTKNQEAQRDRIAIQQAQISQQRLVIVAVSVVLLLLVTLIFVVYRYSRKTKQMLHELQERNEEIQTQTEELKASNDLITDLNESLEAKVKERTLSLEQANQELDTFFYRSSHDFRRPLTTFMGLAEVAKVTVKDPIALDLFDKVKVTAVTLDHMLNKLRSISTVDMEQAAPQQLSVRALIENVLHRYNEEILHANVKVDLRIQTTAEIHTYPLLLTIIVENLIENAIRFRNTSNPEVLIDVQSRDEGVQLSVADNGIGIEDLYADRVWGMFFRGSEQSKGNGLGLYLVKRAAGRMNGKVTLTSIHHKGTTVTLWFPLQPSRPS